MPRPARSRQTAVGRALRGKNPGEVVVLKPTKRVTRKSGKGLIQTSWAVKDSGALFVEVDARRYVREVQLALADHCAESLMRQVRPDNGRPLRDPDEVAANREMRRVFGSVKQNDETLMIGGEMAQKWYVGQVKGNHVKAQGLVRPSIDGKRLKWINYYLGAPTVVERTNGGDPIAIKRTHPPVDIQSTEGLAAAVITETVGDLATRSMGSKVKTPPQVSTRATDRRRR